MKKLNCIHKQGAFTLLEAMIVITICFLIAVIVIPQHSRNRDSNLAERLVISELAADSKAVVIKSINPDVVVVDYNDKNIKAHTAKIRRSDMKIVEVDGQPWPTPAPPATSVTTIEQPTPAAAKE